MSFFSCTVYLQSVWGLLICWCHMTSTDFFIFLAVNPATPSLGDNFFLLASWFIHMLLWKHGGLIMQMREDQPKNWFKDWKCFFVIIVHPPQNGNKSTISWTFLLSHKMLCPQYLVCFWHFFLFESLLDSVLASSVWFQNLVFWLFVCFDLKISFFLTLLFDPQNLLLMKKCFTLLFKAQNLLFSWKCVLLGKRFANTSMWFINAY